MQVIYVGLVFFLREIRNAPSSEFSPVSLDLQRLPSNEFLTGLHSSSSYNTCDKTKLKNKVPDANFACHSECLALQAEIRAINRENRTDTIIQYLYGYLFSKCGMVTEGFCGTALLPFCWCKTQNTLNSSQNILLFFCRQYLQILRKFSKAEAKTSSNISNKYTQLRANSLTNDVELERVAMHGFPPYPKDHRSHRRSASSVSRPHARSESRPTTSSDTRPSGRSVTRSASRAPHPAYGSHDFPIYPPGFEPRPPNSTRDPAYGGPEFPIYPPGFEPRPSNSAPVPAYGIPDFPIHPPGFEPRPRPMQQHQSRRPVPDQSNCYLAWIKVRVADENLLALLDTGSCFSIIHPDYAGEMIPYKMMYRTVDNKLTKMRGRTTIDLELDQGTTISITGVVTGEKHHRILLGTDFFVAYVAKINISEKDIEIFTGQTKKTIPIVFQSDAPRVSMMNAVDPYIYTPLQILIRLNGQDMRMQVDTGSSLTMVKKEYVNQQTFQPTSVTTFVGDSSVSFLGSTEISIWIESNKFTFSAFVAESLPFNILTGNDFIMRYVERIDYGSRKVTLILPGHPGNNRVVASALIHRGR